MRVAIYLRVPAAGQVTDPERLALEDVAARRGWQIIEVYSDQGLSGAKGRDKRPALDRLCKDAERRRFDALMAWSIDRIGCSVHGVSRFIAEMEALGIGQYYHLQGIDTATPAGKAMIQMCVVLAEFERDMVRARIIAGLTRARAQGKRLGRPGISPKKKRAIRAALDEGNKGILKIAAKLGSARAPYSGSRPP